MHIENIEETIDKRFESLHLHYEILSIEHNHWVTEVAIRKATHQLKVARLPSCIQPHHLKRGRQLVMMAFDQLRDAGKKLERVRFNVEGTRSFIRFLEREESEREESERERWRETVGGES
ncbi:hypothetical protein E8E11_009646 [Didymella keratinophila]|nr:hypothetical protein E8E11_009646 [Didymella keratinophila]